MPTRRDRDRGATAATEHIHEHGTDASFGGLLRRYRREAGLTQEALAERAGVSVRNIQNLERGENRPLRDTARRLADALALPAEERTRFLAAATPPHASARRGPRARTLPRRGPARCPSRRPR